MLPIKDIMSKNVFTVRRDTPIMQAARLLVENRITGMPVVDDDNNLVGILSEFDVLRLMTDEVVTAEKTVDLFMTKKVVFFEQEATAIEICDFFLTNPSKRRVPITHNGKLVGLVSRSDIVKLIVRLRQDRG